MANVKYLERGKTTDVEVDGKYVGAVIELDDGRFVTSHKSDKVESKTFEKHQKHFALYYVEKN